MIRNRLTLLLLVSMTLYPGSLLADFGKPDWYAGFKLSYFEIEESDLKKRDSDDPDNTGFLIGFESKFEQGYMGIETEFTRTFVSGTFDGQETGVDTVGVFLVYRTLGPATFRSGPYLKLKSGLFHYDTIVGDKPGSDMTGAIGIGFGINMKIVRFELDIIAPYRDVGFVSMHILF